MSNKRDDMWKRRQSWLHLSKHPEPERTDFWNILRLVAEEPRWAKNIDPACKAFSLDSTKPIDRTLLLGILSSICFPDPESLGAEALFPGYRLRKPRGRRNEWPPDRIRMLVRDAAIARARSPQTDKLRTIAWRLQKPKTYGPFKGDWSKLKIPTLEKYLRKLKKSGFN